MAGRLQVEVWHGTEISEADRAEPAGVLLTSTDGDQQDRRLDCVVRTTSLFEVCRYRQDTEHEIIYDFESFQ